MATPPVAIAVKGKFVNGHDKIVSLFKLIARGGVSIINSVIVAVSFLPFHIFLISSLHSLFVLVVFVDALGDQSPRKP